MFTDKLWDAIYRLRSDVQRLQLETVNVKRTEYNQDALDRFRIKHDLRLQTLEDAVSRIARTLDANHIAEACSHCGQVKPEDWKKAQV